MMTLAMLSAISLICIDAVSAARPLPVSEPVIEIAAANIQAAPETAPDLMTPPVEDAAEEAPEINNDVVSDGEEYTGPLAFDGESDEAVAERLIGYIEDLDTLTGDFTQIAPSGAISSGRFYLRRPGFLRFEYDPPTPLLIVANGGLVYVRDEALETTDSYPVGKTPLKLLLRKKIDRDDAKIVSVDRGVDTVAVTFASDDETEGVLTIIARAPEMSLERWIVRDLQNGITVVTLENVESGVRLANRLFRAPEAGGQFLKN
jgi:outer membrane lipoprotein-sorting protein